MTHFFLEVAKSMTSLTVNLSTRLAQYAHEEHEYTSLTVIDRNCISPFRFCSMAILQDLSTTKTITFVRQGFCSFV